MHTFRSAANLRRFLSVILSYCLLISLLTISPGRAAAARLSAGAKVGAAAASTTPARQDAPRRGGELLVRFREGVSEKTKDVTVSARGARRKGKARGESGMEKLELREGQDAAATAADLGRDPSVEMAEPNFLVSHDEVTPDDARFAEQWALSNSGQSGGTPGSDIHASAAWRQTTGAPSTVVAVVDGGIDFSHPDLAHNVWKNTRETPDNGLDDDGDGLVDDVYGWNWAYGTNNAGDEQGHGTSVAGIIAAEGNNHLGVAGVMWRASLMSLKVLDSTGNGDVASAVEAIDYAVAHGASVINCSWGTDADSQFLRDAIERAGKRGVVVVTSAGNSGRDLNAQPYYPASYDLDNLISVASSDGFDGLAQFSNRGATRVSVAAPGTDILTTQLGGDYRYVSGTSASAPMVAGIAGLIKTLRPGVKAAAVRAAVLDGARKVDALTGKVSSGGVADAAGALGSLVGNPYAGGDGSRGNGRGNGQPYVPPALRHDNDKDRGKDKSGRTAAPPATSKGAPGPNLPDLEGSRRRDRSSTSTSGAPIHADLPCADCDPSGGGGAGSYFPNDPYLGTARSRTINDTGDPGVNLGSRNFNWNVPIFSLPGRAGLDLDISLYYNSLVWTKQSGVMQYNPDHGTPAPGFQIGLPRLQALFFDSDANANAYILITPSGGRVEMRQTPTSGVYESADSTYTQLTFSGSTPVVRSGKGVQYVFGLQVGAEWRCTQIKDRNGNYISATYDNTNGHLQTVTDTLNRTVNFNYNTDGTLNTITQSWAGATHTYAQFLYGSVTMSLNFPGLAVSGTSNGASQTVLSAVLLGGTTASNHLDSYGFNYNSYGQVYSISRAAPDGHELARTTYTFNTGVAQSDCPRFTERREWAQSWNGDTDGAFSQAEEAVTSYTVTDGVGFTHPVSGAMTGTLSQETAPDGTVFKQYSKTTGWDALLPQLTEVWSAGAKKTWSCYVWTQDNTSLTYQKNPRVIETNTYDSDGNRKRTTIEYNSGYGLPTAVREWGGATGQTLLKLTTTDYHLEQSYLNTRVIGLPYLRQVYDGAGNLASKEAYFYDWDGWHLEDVNGGNVTHHDTAYNTTFTAGRGNLVLVQRYDINDPNDAGGTHVEFKYRYNITGSLIGTVDPGWSQVNISYADSFSDGINSRNTYAYPTTVTDPEGYASTTQYNYDFGAVTLTHKPTSGTGTGITYADVTTQYDEFARAVLETNLVNNAFRKFVYETNDNYIHTYEAVNDTNQLDLTTKFHTWVILDGAGRVRARAGDHPGSTGGFSGQYTVYNNMGRVVQQSNPTEMTGQWVPAGDDSSWIYTGQTYDWKGRPLQTTNADGTTKIVSYGGCGCAGGQVATVQDEHGRQKRYTEDTLGRLSKVEEMYWNTGSVYSTTTYAYNARDQLTQMNQQGQTRTIDYDGHGRVWHRTTPEQGMTTYTYNSDDTLARITDARGAKVNYSYTMRKLISGISYDLTALQPGQSVSATASVSYLYDAAGNRFWMSDGQGWASYHYDAMGRMDWEERNFTNVGTYHTSYAYNVGGELTSTTNPWGAQVTYSYDKAGRLSGVGGANYAGVSTYASGVTYRAFGAVKGMAYGDTHSLSTSYDNRMRPTKWFYTGLFGYKYYYDDFNERTGRVTFAQAITDATAGLARNQTSSTLDRSYEYDLVGRLAYAHSGAEARAHAFSGQWGTMDGAYSHGYEYDVYGNMTHRYGWGGEVQGGSPGVSTDITYTHTGNRRNGFSYDNSGNLTFDGGQHFTYDATGQQTGVDWTNLQQYYDGDGLRVKRTEDGTYPALYVRSKVLGGQVTAEILLINGSWQWSRGYVYAGGSLLAVQQSGVFFVHEDPVTKSKRVTNTSGAVQSSVELDPWGADTSFSSNSAFQPRKFTSYERDGNGTDEAMFRRYNRWHSRFDQPDPFDGSYDFTNPQSFNRYAYTENDPVNFTDPKGLEMCYEAWCGWGAVANGFWGGGFNFNDRPSAGRQIVETGFKFDVVEIELRWSYETEVDGEMVIRFFTLIITYDTGGDLTGGTGVFIERGGRGGGGGGRGRQGPELGGGNRSTNVIALLFGILAAGIGLIGIAAAGITTAAAGGGGAAGGGAGIGIAALIALINTWIGHPYPTKPNNGGIQQPWDPANGRWRSYADNPGFINSPSTQFAVGFAQGYGAAISNADIPTPVTPAQAWGQFMGYAYGSIPH